MTNVRHHMSLTEHFIWTRRVGDLYRGVKNVNSLEAAQPTNVPSSSYFYQAERNQ